MKRDVYVEVWLNRLEDDCVEVPDEVRLSDERLLKYGDCVYLFDGYNVHILDRFDDCGQPLDEELEDKSIEYCDDADLLKVAFWTTTVYASPDIIYDMCEDVLKSKS